LSDDSRARIALVSEAKANKTKATSPNLIAVIMVFLLNFVANKSARRVVGDTFAERGVRLPRIAVVVPLLPF
jgi:hypothetical protein